MALFCAEERGRVGWRVRGGEGRGCRRRISYPRIVSLPGSFFLLPSSGAAVANPSSLLVDGGVDLGGDHSLGAHGLQDGALEGIVGK